MKVSFPTKQSTSVEDKVPNSRPRSGYTPPQSAHVPDPLPLKADGRPNS